jgi:hypothetical protein
VITADRDKERGTVKDDKDLAVHASNQIRMWQSRSGLEKSVEKSVIEAMLGRNSNYRSSTNRIGHLV